MDSIPTCEDQEDHVAMSTTAARRAARVVKNARLVIAIEILGAVRALQFRVEEQKGLVLGVGTAIGLQRASAVLDALPTDATPGQQIEALAAWLARGEHGSVVGGLERIG